MKKVLFLIVAVIMAAASANAQKGVKAVGLEIGGAPTVVSAPALKNFGVGAKFQYGVADPFRVELGVNYWMKSMGFDILDVTVNTHILFKVNDKLTFYPVFGLGYAHIGGGFGDFDDDDYDYYKYSPSRGWVDWDDDDDWDEEDGDLAGGANKFVMNLGAGVEYAITSNISAFFEAKMQYVKDFTRVPVVVGFTYKF